MSFRLRPTPMDAPFPMPEPRTGGMSAAVREAIVPAPGTESLRGTLALPDVLVVTTGQQPALLLGPLYTLHKALSARALAAACAEAWQRPVVPVFWSAGDDHDWDEARGAWWTNADGALVAGSLPPREPGTPMTPLSRVPMTGVQRILDEFAHTTPGSPWKEAHLALLAEHYRDDVPLGRGYATALAALLAPLGVLVLDSTHPTFKAAAAPLLLEAVRRAPALDAALSAREQALLAVAADPGVPVEPRSTLVMVEGSAGRDRLVGENGAWQLRRSGEPLDGPALERLAAQEPERLSANVLLRPVVESALLPTVAYCAGPGELRYLPLAGAAFDVMEVHRPAAVPRWSGVVIDAQVERVLERFRLSEATLLDPAVDVLALAAREHLPPGVSESLVALREATALHLDALAGAGRSVAEPLGRSVDGSRRRIEHELARIERRFVRSLKQRHTVELRQLGRARTAVLPADRPQERVLCGAGLLARHGPPLLAALAGAAEQHVQAALEGRLASA